MVHNDPVQSLRMENARLHQALAESSRQVERLQASLDAALAELAALRTEARATQQELLGKVAALAEQVARGNDRVTELLAIAQRKKRSEKKSDPKPQPAPPALDDATRAAYDARPKPPEIPAKPEKKPSTAKPTGRKPLPSHLVAEEHTVFPQVCSCGCRDFDIVDEVEEEKLTVVREHHRRRVVHRKTGRCKRCRKRTTARSLPAPFARSKVTCSWMAWLVVQKYVQLTPLDRIRDLLHLQGIPLAMSFLVTQIQRATDLLDAIDGVHWQQLLAGGWMTHDATPLAVLVEGVPGTHKGHLEVFQRDGLVVLQYEHDKAGATLASKLTKFRGTLVADAEHRHNATYASGRVLEAGCNAHGERKLEAAEVSQPLVAAEGRAFIGAIFAEEARAQEQGLEGDALRTWRQERIGPLYEKFARWRDAVLPSLLPEEPLAGVLRYYQNHWTALTRWVDDPRLPPDNSASERVFQRVAKLRLACLFAGSTEGAHSIAVLMGLSATCRNLRVDPQAYFTWALERRGTHADVFGLSAEQLTPAAYKTTLGA